MTDGGTVPKSLLIEKLRGRLNLLTPRRAAFVEAHIIPPDTPINQGPTAQVALR